MDTDDVIIHHRQKPRNQILLIDNDDVEISHVEADSSKLHMQHEEIIDSDIDIEKPESDENGAMLEESEEIRFRHPPRRHQIDSDVEIEDAESNKNEATIDENRPKYELRSRRRIDPDIQEDKETEKSENENEGTTDKDDQVKYELRSEDISRRRRTNSDGELKETESNTDEATIDENSETIYELRSRNPTRRRRIHDIDSALSDMANKRTHVSRPSQAYHIASSPGDSPELIQVEPNHYSEGDDESDDDNFIVDDAEEIEDDEHNFSHAAVDAKLDHENDEFEIQNFALPFTRPTISDAFVTYFRYLAFILVDGEFCKWVQNTPSARTSIYPAISVIEEKFNKQRDDWVRSSLWLQTSRSEFLNALLSLPYSEFSTVSEIDPNTGSPRECQACTRSHHLVTHKISFYGVPYNPDKLVHPFKEKHISEVLAFMAAGEIYDENTVYDRKDFYVGRLCHQRIMLYHSMRHFKLHLMLHLRSKLSEIGAIENPTDKKKNVAIVEKTFSPASLTDTISHLIRTHRNEYETLLKFSEEYSRQDAREARIDVNTLRDMIQRSFDNDACFTRIFSLRPRSSQTYGKVKENDKKFCVNTEIIDEIEEKVNNEDIDNRSKIRKSVITRICSQMDDDDLKLIANNLSRNQKQTLQSLLSVSLLR